MTTVWVSLLTLIGGAVVSGALTYVGTKRKLSLDYDADLRERRINAYQDLWKRLEPLSKYVPPTFSHAVVNDLAESMRTWYFRDGGLFLSTAARNDYFALQDILKRITTDGWGWATPGKEKLTTEAREILRTYGSRLRTGLTLDVGTRSRPKMKGYVEPVNRQLEGMYGREGSPEKIQVKFSPRALGGTRRVHVTFNGPVGKTISASKWMPSRMVIRVTWESREDGRLEKEFLMEGGQIVEGPSRNGGDADPVIWKRIPIDDTKANHLSSVVGSY
jgi:hypothetical protein